MLFNENEWRRYQRHVQLPQFGVTGQTRLKKSHVLIVGAGGLGCPASQYLAAAGVGTITLVDGDRISRSNLQRQILFGEQDINQFKTEVARQRLVSNNPNIVVNSLQEHLSPQNASALIETADLVLDCTDNFATRYLINDLCVNLKTPWVYASVVQYSGQLALFTPETACFRCLFQEAPEDIPDCNSAGVLSSLPGMLALMQANEAIKFLSGLPTTLKNHLMLVEGLELGMRKIKLKKNQACVCHSGSIDTSIQNYEAVCANDTTREYELSRNNFDIMRNKSNHIVIDVRSIEEHQAFNIGGKNIPFRDDFIDQFCSTNPTLEQTYLLYCQSGNRSYQALEALKKQNYPHVYSLKSGLGHSSEA